MIKDVRAILFPHGRIIADSNFVREDIAWRWALGSEEEIEWAKKNGHHAIRLAIDVDEQTARPVEDHGTAKVIDKAPVPLSLIPSRLITPSRRKC